MKLIECYKSFHDLRSVGIDKMPDSTIQKLGAVSRTQAVATAVRLRLI
ncbi:hypothetical protein PY650_19295 [Rhizobium calliandrae]|uniref:Uncharacterized protein n=1 Tax=Rhizobium calliandrae TaxID=1312182 RepID=A0ABT7KID6_9HYPH|nr:hypothetical protein [Rhizobium calliandrae]MDL2407765.1 hypothetical protein [Rhizobium calliandrae]